MSSARPDGPDEPDRRVSSRRSQDDGRDPWDEISNIVERRQWRAVCNDPVAALATAARLPGVPVRIAAKWVTVVATTPDADFVVSAAEWVSIGVERPEEASRWAEAGFTPEEARPYVGRDPQRVRQSLIAKSGASERKHTEFAAAGFEITTTGEWLWTSAAVAAEWRAAGFDGTTAQQWAEHQFPVAHAAHWRDVGAAPREAEEWLRAGAGPAVYKEWRTRGFRSGHVALEWQKEAFTPEEAQAWSEKGLTVGTAKKGRAAGEDAEACATRLATAGDPFTRKRLASAAGTSPEVFALLAVDSQRMVRDAVRNNKNCPQELRDIARDHTPGR